MIGAYSIVYGIEDARWLAFNIGRLYPRFDEFSIVIGPVAPIFGEERDTESEDFLRAIPDPEDKIRIRSGVWANKNLMAEVACAELKSDIIFQIDADEIWPESVFAETLDALNNSARKVRLHMYTFWKTPEYVVTTPDIVGFASKCLGLSREDIDAARRGKPWLLMEKIKHQRELLVVSSLWQAMGKDEKGALINLLINDPSRVAVGCAMSGEPWTPWLLDMCRAFKRDSLTKITHIPPELAWPNGEPACDDKAVTLGPIWHFSYTGAERVRRKFEFFNKRDGKGQQVMPPYEYFDKWTEKDIGDQKWMTGQLRSFAQYDGPPIEPDVLAFVEETCKRSDG